VEGASSTPFHSFHAYVSVFTFGWYTPKNDFFIRNIKKNAQKLGNDEKNSFLCRNDKIKCNMTNTITIDSRVYADISDYAKKHDLNIRHLVEEYFKKLIKGEQTSTEKPVKNYYVSTKIKPLLVGFKCDESLPYDYKREARKYKADKYL
jgi:hypothetical protein